MNKELIITINTLQGIGYASTKKLMDYIISHEIDLGSLNLLCTFLKHAQSIKLLTKNQSYSIQDIENANSKALRTIENSAKRGIQITSMYDNDYPEQFKSIIDKDNKSTSPLFLNYIGDLQKVSQMRGIAIIGTRNPTKEGIIAGMYYGEKFAEEGFNIVSGLALGCDTAGHEGAIKGRGVTTAIVAHGLDTIYPKENSYLAEQIIDTGGLLLSEYFIGTPPLRNFFIERDRLQSGLSEATIVVQTGIRGGTMHAVNATKVNKKPLFIVNYERNPHLRTHSSVEGNYMLLNDEYEFVRSLYKHEEAIKYLNEFYNNNTDNNSVQKPNKEIKKSNDFASSNNQMTLNFDV